MTFFFLFFFFFSNYTDLRIALFTKLHFLFIFHHPLSSVMWNFGFCLKTSDLKPNTGLCFTLFSNLTNSDCAVHSRGVKIKVIDLSYLLFSCVFCKILYCI